MKRVLTVGAVVVAAALVGTVRVAHNLLALVDRAEAEVS